MQTDSELDEGKADSSPAESKQTDGGGWDTAGGEKEEGKRKGAGFDHWWSKSREMVRKHGLPSERCYTRSIDYRLLVIAESLDRPHDPPRPITVSHLLQRACDITRQEATISVEALSRNHDNPLKGVTSQRTCRTVPHFPPWVKRCRIHILTSQVWKLISNEGWGGGWRGSFFFSIIFSSPTWAWDLEALLLLLCLLLAWFFCSPFCHSVHPAALPLRGYFLSSFHLSWSHCPSPWPSPAADSPSSENQFAFAAGQCSAGLSHIDLAIFNLSSEAAWAFILPCSSNQKCVPSLCTEAVSKTLPSPLSLSASSVFLRPGLHHWPQCYDHVLNEGSSEWLSYFHLLLCLVFLPTSQETLSLGDDRYHIHSKPTPTSYLKAVWRRALVSIDSWQVIRMNHLYFTAARTSQEVSETSFPLHFCNICLWCWKNDPAKDGWGQKYDGWTVMD